MIGKKKYFLFFFVFSRSSNALLANLSFVMLDREGKLVRFHFRAPGGMQFVRFESTSRPKTVDSMRNILVHLKEEELYAMPRGGINCMPVYSNVDLNSSSSDVSVATLATVIRAPKPLPISTSIPLPVSSVFSARAETIFKKRSSVFDARPVMEKVNMELLNGHKVDVDRLPRISVDMCHSMRFWLCVKYIEAMLAKNRAVKYVRTCYYFGVLLTPVRRIVNYNLKYPNSVKTPVYYNLYSPEEAKLHMRKKLIFEFGRVCDITQYLEYHESERKNCLFSCLNCLSCMP